MPDSRKARYAYALLTAVGAAVFAFATVVDERTAVPPLRLATIEPGPADTVIVRGTIAAAAPPASAAVAPLSLPLPATKRSNGVPALAVPARAETPEKSAARTPAIAFVSPPPARFFTINQVMAKRAGRSVRAAPIKLASLDDAAVARDVAPPFASSKDGVPFGLAVFRAPDGALWSKWRTVEKELKRDAGIVAGCRANPDACQSREARHYIAVVDAAKKLHGRERLQEVHKAVNISIRYLSDMAQHHAADRWSTAIASFTTGYGDCEDYAIANFEILQDAGIAVDDMQILLVRDKFKNIGHAVLAVREGGKWVILDSLKPYLVEAKDVPQYVPLYALGRGGVKLFAAPYAMKEKPDQTAMLPASTGAASWAFKSSLE